MKHKVFRRDEPSEYEQVVSRFLTGQNGALLLVSKDVLFVKVMRATLRSMALTYDRMHLAYSGEDCFQKCGALLKSCSQVVLMVESRIDGRSTVYDFKKIKDWYKDSVKIICVTPEVDENNVSFIAEQDVDSIIVKPISISNIIQKIAHVLKPVTAFSVEIDRVKALIDNKAFSEAVRALDALLEQKPGSAICLVLKGDIAMHRQDIREAERCYLRAKQGSRLNLKPLQKLVDLYASTDNIRDMLRYLVVMDKISPLNHQRKIQIGEQYSKVGEDRRAALYFSEAVAVVSEQAQDMLAATLMDIGLRVQASNPEQGLEFMRQAMEAKGDSLSREDLWMVNEMGVSLRRRGDWQGAVQTYRKALLVVPGDSGLHYNMGMAYMQGREYLKAVAEFDQAVAGSGDLLRESPLIAYNIGMAHFQLENHAEVRRYMDIALAVDPKFEKARALLDRLEGNGDASDPSSGLC